jgi:hypothetical protein
VHRVGSFAHRADHDLGDWASDAFEVHAAAEPVDFDAADPAG